MRPLVASGKTTEREFDGARAISLGALLIRVSHVESGVRGRDPSSAINGSPTPAAGRKGGRRGACPYAELVVDMLEVLRNRRGCEP